MARPTKLTEAVQRRICEAIAAGNTWRAVAEFAGIGESTMRNWLAKGRTAKRADSPYRAFLAAIKKAEADAEVRNVAIIQKTAQGGQVIERTTRTKKDGTTEVTEKFAPSQWTASAWWLERRLHAEWGRKDTRKLEGLEAILARLPGDFAREVRAAFGRAVSGEGDPPGGEG